ncbi:MAG: tetratricopeptide repeat protein [Anaerolineales bacterium]|nr:tetratricopeptide repeat protein [Anaerolineales bacterium]
MARALEAHDAVMPPDYEGALLHWERSVDLRSDLIDYHIGLGRCALNSGQPARTREVCSRLLEMHQIDANAASSERATTGEVYALLAQSMLALGEHEAAGEHFQRATELAPQCSEPWRAIAAFHKNRGELDRARSALETGLQNVGSDNQGSKGVLLTDIARLQLKLEETDAAIESLRQASTLRPTDGEIHFKLGEALLAQGDHTGAVETLKRAAANLPADASVWHALGKAQQISGDSAAALEALQRAQASGLHSKELAAQTGRLALELNKFDLARSNLETVAKEDGAEISTLCAYASTLEQAEDWHSALDVYKRAIQLQPENNELIARLGACCLELGQTEAAIAALSPAAESSPDDLVLQQTAAQAYAQAKMWTDALPLFERVVRLAPDDVSALKTAALASENTGDRQHAIELLHRAAALQPENPDVHAHLAHVYAGDKRWEEARDTITVAIAFNDQDKDFYHQLGEYHSALGDSDAALSAYFRATEIDPENATMLEALAEAQFKAEKYNAAHTTFMRTAHALRIPTEESPETGSDLVRRFIILGRAGDALVAQRQDAQAIALWQKALLEDHPDDALLHQKLGEALLRQGRNEEASAAYENAIRADNADTDALIGAAEAALALGEEIRARHHVEKLAQHSLDSPLMAYRLGIVCRRLGQFTGALFAFRQAVTFAPEQGIYRAMMARALAETGDRAAASDEADRALANAPSDMIVLGNAGIALLQCERRSEALKCFRRAVASNETDCGTHFSIAKALVRAAELQRLYAVEDTHPEHERKLIADALDNASKLGMQSETAKEWLARAQLLVGDVNAAIPTLEAIGGRVPTADIFCALAAGHHLDGDHLKAQQAARWVLDRNPEHLSALLQLSTIAASLGDAEGEITALERAITLAPEDPVPHYMLGQALLYRENHGAAKTSISRAVQLAPERADWHFRLGEVFRECNEPEASLSHFQTAAHLAQDQRMPARVIANYRANLARAHASDGDDTAAREQYEAALQLDNTQSEWILEAANACMLQGDSSAALERFEQAAQAKPNGIEPLVGGMKAAMAIGDAKQAERYALNALKQDPDNSSALTVLSELYSQRGDTENALVSLEHAADNTSDKGPVLLAKAQVLVDSHRVSEALAVLEDAMPHLNDDDRAWALVGALKDHDGDHEAGITAYTRASALAPLNLDYHLRLGQLCRKEKQLEQALVHLNSAMKLQSSGAEAGAIQEELGKVFADRRQFNRAYKAFANAIKNTPTNAPLYFHAGVALKNLRDYGEAIAMFRKAVQMDPKNLAAHRQLAAVSALGLINGEASV